MIKTLTILLAALTIYSVDTIDNNDNQLQRNSYEANLSIPELNNMFKMMRNNEDRVIKLEDDSYYTVHKTEDGEKLLVEVHLYSPMEMTHKLAFASSYRWNDIAHSLIASVCKGNDISIHPPKLEPKCQEAIMVGSRLIGLEIEGTIDLEDFESENIEKCLREKLDPKVFEDSYLKCLVTIIGDPEYARKALEDKVKHFRSIGYNCDDKGACYKHRSAQITSQLLDHYKHPQRMVKVQGDPRLRTCDIGAYQASEEKEDDQHMPFSETHVYDCDWRVTKIYCKQDQHKLHWGFEYQNIDGAKNYYFTNPFPIDGSVDGFSSRTVHTDDGEHISAMVFNNDPNLSMVQGLRFEFTSGDDPFVCELSGIYGRNNELKPVRVEVKGEIAGFMLADTVIGVKAKIVYVRE